MPNTKTQVNQLDADEEITKSLLDQLISDSKMYTQSKEYKDLLDFVIRLRNFAPFNAMLLQIQKPGLRFAASARDWRERFDRTIEEGARPLVILWPFGPVAFVYDMMDTEPKPIPENMSAYFAYGAIDKNKISSFISMVEKKNIKWHYVDAGDNNAGAIGEIHPGKPEEKPQQYQMTVNQNHSPAIQFSTIAHELGHLFLGHIGRNKKLKVPDRKHIIKSQREFEAESVAFIVCERNGVTCKSESYLADHVKENTTVDEIDIYQVMRAAGQVETILGLNAHIKFDKPS